MRLLDHAQIEFGVIDPHGSPGKQPVLKAKVQRWLAQCAEVIAFAQASGPQGGAGALIVLLAGSPPRAG